MAEFQVTGPPGCGKTTYLAAQAARAADTHGGENVLALSLTKAAAAEFGGRGSGVVHGTMHSICYRALDLGGKLILDSPKGIKEWNERDLVKRNGWRIGSDSEFDPDDPIATAWALKEGKDGVNLLARMNIYRHGLVPREVWPSEVLKGFAAEWDQFADDADSTDFTGMIELCYRHIRAAPGFPKVLLGDEAQDYSKLEAALFRKWAQQADTSILCADPDQSIYQWRGADARIFLDHEVPPDHRRLLSQSYRVPRAVHELAQNTIRRIRDRVDVEYAPRDDPGAVYRERSSWREPERWIDAVLNATTEGSVMLLATCSYMLDPTIRVLKRLGVPFQNRYRRKSGKWNPLHSTKDGAAHHQLLDFLAHGKPEWSTKELRSWIELIRAREAKGLRAILRTGAKSANLSDPWTNSEYAALWLDERDGIAAFDKDPEWLLAHCLPKHIERLDYAVRVLKRRGMSALVDEPKLEIGTIHSTKGGESDHVFLFTDVSTQSRHGISMLTFNPLEHNALSRLFYVGITRARKQLTVIDCPRGFDL